MSDSYSDALVFFGATGDLAYKMIFPALQAMVKRGRLNAPVIGVAKSGWTLDQLRARARDSLEKHGGIDPAAFQRLSGLLRYVDGDYQDPATFQKLRKELGAAERPAHYLAIPPALFATVVEQLGKSGCAKNARVIIEKPFGTDLASARNRNNVESMQITMAEDFGIQGRGAFYDQTGAIRDVAQNHLFQVLTNLAMEPPARTDSESIRDEKVKVLKAMPPLDVKNVVRGQFRGYRTEKRVALTCTEVLVRLRRPPTIYPSQALKPNHLRLRISPDVTIALGMMTLTPGAEMAGQAVEMQVSHHPQAGEMDAYERLLGDAMAGDATLFAREDYVEEAWRIVDPALKADTPVYVYEPGSWGPDEVDQHVSPAGGWHNPAPDETMKVGSG